MWQDSEDFIGFSERKYFQGFFLDIVKKTQAQKNSKLKQNLEKTQAESGKNSKTANSSWIFFTNLKVFPIFAHVVNFLKV